ncbi:hypothetical protein SprV_1002890100 [Sparganum proliferum]
MACKRERREAKECSQTVRQCRAKEEEASLPRAKTASSVEVRRAKYRRGSFMPASSVHWLRGHLASGGVNISTMFNLFLPSCPPATMIFPRKYVAASASRAVLMGAAGCQKSDEVALSRQSARSWQNSTEASPLKGRFQPPKTKTLLSPGRQTAAVELLFSRRSGSLNHLCVGEEEASEAAKQEDFARKKRRRQDECALTCPG